MKLTEAQANEIAARIDSAFGSRDIITMNTSSMIGQSNFYGDESKPQFTRNCVMACIKLAIDNWYQPENETDEEWAEEVATDIINDIL